MNKSLDWLEGLPRFSTLKFNLYRAWALLNRFVPEYNKLDMYFITGSKGKGTVAATLAAILRSGGIKTGLVTSPHIMKVTERINFNGIDIEDYRLAGYLEEIAGDLPVLPDQCGNWIHSEVINTAALMWFMDMGVQTVVLEAGMGGRLDAGNVFRRPVATCISCVSLEHKGILGDTIEQIAGEKAGVIKPETPLVTAAAPGPMGVIKRRAGLFGAPLFSYGSDFDWQQHEDDVKLILPGRSISFRHGFETEANQVNKAMAACLASFHPQVRDEAMIQGLGMPGLPGRFEVHLGHPAYVLDVAHTPESIDNLLAGVKKRFPKAIIAFVAGFLADKSAGEMLQMMLAASSEVFYAPVKDIRSIDITNPLITGPKLCDSIAAAMGQAAAAADVICVTGSFAAVREARIILSNRN